MSYTFGNQLVKRLGALAMLVVLFMSSAAVVAQDGAALFKTHCSSCHKTTDQTLTGPGLAGLMDRVPDEEWVYKWIKNSSAMIAEGDPYAVEIYEKFNKTNMTLFAFLKDEEIGAILEYVKNPPPPPGGEEVAGSTACYGEEGQDESNSTLYFILILGGVFFIVINGLVGVKRSLQNMQNAKDGKEPEVDRSHWESVIYFLTSNKRRTALLALILLVFGLVKMYHGMSEVGIYQGYAPEQPIKFSHKVHAGDNAINCVYCHSSAIQGKTSGIPSVNVCMNCHKGIQEGKETGKEEIAKIYEAVGWDPAKGQYDPNAETKPIKWVKIHNLPDFVYFNHSQHVVAGNQECQTCHGPVEEMCYPMRQHADLTMGWCINCHRETKVSMKGNEYYDKMHADLKAKYAAEGKTSFTVEDIGGLECAKCHY